MKKILLLPGLLIAFVGVFAQSTSEKDLQFYLNSAPFKMPAITVPTFSNKAFNIKDYGAVSDGQTLNTQAIAKAVDACAKAGGGRVVVPAGSWLTGPIELKSNINLHVERGGLVLFTPDLTQYPIIKASSTSSSYTPASPIYGYDLKNIAITGDGIIDGNGQAWRPVKKSKVTASEWKDLVAGGGVVGKGDIWWPSNEAMEGENYLKQLKKDKPKATEADYLPARTFLRPYMVLLSNCQNVLIEGITLRNSPKFVFYPNHCTNLVVRKASILNEWNAQNGDGIDISACKNVAIYQNTVSVGDDGICMKSSGGKSDSPNDFQLENIVIADNTVYRAHGGFVIGSNTDGNMRNIWVNNCTFVGTDIGLRIKSNAGRGGLVKDIFIKDIFMSQILDAAILFDTYYEDVPAGATADSVRTTLRDKTPNFRDFTISNVYCNGAKTAIAITGLPEMPVNHITFNNVVISANTGVQSTDASDITFNNVNIITAKSPVYNLTNSKNFTINGVTPGNAKTFIALNGKSSKVAIGGKNAQAVKSAIQLNDGITASEVVVK
jgi:polygalacturonase